MCQKWLNRRVLFGIVFWVGVVLPVFTTSASRADDLTLPVSLHEDHEGLSQGLTIEEWGSIQRQLELGSIEPDADYLPPKLVKKVVAGDIVASDAYGISVAVSGDTLVVGTYYADIGGFSQRGAAYIFYRNHGALPIIGVKPGRSSPSMALSTITSASW